MGFPSRPNKKKKGKSKGGVVLIKLKQNENEKQYDHVVIECSFENREGETFKNVQHIVLGSNEKKECYGDLAVRKAILLTRYVLLIKEWIQNTKSFELSVSDKYKQIFAVFLKYFQNE